MNSINYPTCEKALKQQIDLLMSEWKEYLFLNSDKSLAAKYEVGNMSELFVSDGFYPYYTRQRQKILFIGRECLDLAGGDYIEVLHNAIKHDKRIGGKALNSSMFHAMMLYVAYALEKGQLDYKSLLWADVIADSFAQEGGVSYAFMNLSKYSNESGEWQKDSTLIRSFLETSGKEFFARELQLLNPDLIITMNLVDQYKDTMGTFTNSQSFGATGQVCLHTLNTSLGSYKVVDTYHFSAPSKKPKEDLFDPIIEACRAIANNHILRCNGINWC